MRSLFKSLCITGVLLFATQASQAATAGKEYVNIPKPQATKTQAGKPIEVIEFFWYGCSHCYHLEPALTTWLKTRLPADVTFRRIPAAWNAGMAEHAQLYYTFEQLKLTDKMHAAAFDAIHKDGKELRDSGVLYSWLASKGVDAKAFSSMYNSFGIVSQAKRAQQLMTDYNVNGVPTFIVNGKYQTSPSQAGSEAKLFKTIEELVAKERALTAPVKASAAKPVTKKVPVK